MLKMTEIILNYVSTKMRESLVIHIGTLVQRVALAVTVLAAFSTPVSAQPGDVVVSVAASVADALDEIAGLYRAAAGVTVAINPGGSNALARQIIEGANAALFVSADEQQMNAVEKAGRVVAGTRTDLLTNELAIVVPRSSAGLTVAQLLEGRVNRLAMGDTAAVPAGVYGRTWLEHEGAWARLAAKVVPFPTVRAVLGAVESGRVDAGIVYRTDAAASTARVVATLAAHDHPYLDITYPVAVIKGPGEAQARRFLEFLKGPQARAVFERRGFGAPRR